MKRLALVCLAFLLVAVFASTSTLAQTDPGVRGGAAGAGQPLPSVAANNPATSLDFFNDGLDRFSEVDSVSGTIEAGKGLGPRFNSRSCAFCHAQPAVGGTSPFSNPQVTDATADGARNTIPSFITAGGPVREARFPFFFNSNGTPNTSSPNGGVEDLFTITGRSDGGSCSLAQPSFALAQQTNNIIFRIPTPTFGAGLIEAIPAQQILRGADPDDRNHDGITGAVNFMLHGASLTGVASVMLGSSEYFSGRSSSTNDGFIALRAEVLHELGVVHPGEPFTSAVPTHTREESTP